MVSLAKNTTSFSNSAINEEDEEALHEEAIIGSEEDVDDLIASTTDGSNAVFNFKSVDTLAVGIFQICASVGMFIVATVVPYECKEHCAIKPLSILLYLHCLFWGIFLICDQYIQYEHIKVRRRGYLDFYNDTRTWSQMPFWVVSTWSTLLLTISTILNDRCNNEADICDEVFKIKKSVYITIFIGIEIVILLAVLVSYLYRVYKFNQSRDLPDVLRDDMMQTSTIDFGPKGLGHIDDEIFERQADLIRHYKDHNGMLSRKVLELSYQISGRTPTLS